MFHESSPGIRGIGPNFHLGQITPDLCNSAACAAVKVICTGVPGVGTWIFPSGMIVIYGSSKSA
jgi:hypothetical protein